VPLCRLSFMLGGAQIVIPKGAVPSLGGGISGFRRLGAAKSAYRSLPVDA
jgi:hypothetical protein